MTTTVTAARIYIAGPMRGIQYFNFPAFDAAKAELQSQGWDVVSPADLDREAGFDPFALGADYDWNDLSACEFSLHDAIDRDIKALKTCNAIYMLSGWEKSFGAKAEKALADWLGLAVIYQDSEEDILEEALRITKGDRNAAYGPPDQDFQRAAEMWSAIKGVPFEAREVAMFMIALKLSRETHQRKRDNAVDIAGYARCLDICNRAAKGLEKPRRYPLELNDNLHICLWSKDGKFKWTVAYFVADKEGYDLHFVGDRPLDLRVNWDHFRELVILGQRLADERFAEQEDR